MTFAKDRTGGGNHGNLMIVQGGGPTAVFNASLAAIIHEARSTSPARRIYGARGGVRGLIKNEVVDLGSLGPRDLELLRNSPGAALGSSRYKPADAEFEQIVDTLRRLDVRQILFMGGNGTMRGADTLSAACRDAGWDVQVVGVPKTIDNDLAITDRSPGFASAAKYVAQSTRDLGMDLRALPQPVTILETMGRSVGWLAAASALARRSPEDAPHLVYFPEAPFAEPQILADVDNVVSRIGWAVVVVAEGLQRADGSPVYQITDPAQTDALKRPMIGDVAQYLAGVVSAGLGIRCRSEKPGLLGRSCSALVSARDLADAELVGRAGVHALAAGESGCMIALRPLSEAAGSGYDLVPLSAVAGLERPLPTGWMSPGPTNLSEPFRQYLEPLVGPLHEYLPPLEPMKLKKEFPTHA